MASTTESIDETIRTVAARRLGVVDTEITRTVVRSDDPSVAGEWFMLSVRLPGDLEWKAIGRRRMKAELLTIAGTIDPRHLDGKTFSWPRVANGRARSER
jgi:hypothetical protein